MELPRLDLVFLLSTLLLLFQKGAALKCFQCNSAEQADCQEFFDHQNAETLAVQASDCKVDAAEYCIKTTGVWGGVVGTTRWCSSRDMGNQCQFIRYPDHDRVYRACIYTCWGDNCNSSHTLSPRILTITSIFSIGLLLKYFL